MYLMLINEILCSMDQTAADRLVNTSPYLAHIDMGACSQGTDQGAESTDTGQSSGANAQEFCSASATRASAPART